jgi:hypothetical protein
MNALSHMELIFGAVLGVACVVAALPDGPAAPSAQPAVRGAAMQVVVVKAKRMSALEKRQSPGLDAGARGAAAGS